MKDMYSFHKDQQDFEKYYQVVKDAYIKIFSRMGLVAKVTEASGGAFTKKISYEFMVLTDAGEDDILYCQECVFCVNVEIAKGKEGDTCPKCRKGKLSRATASEVGNVFDLGQKYGQDFDIGFIGQDGKKQFPVMGCYGIGISRCMGVIVEKASDERGIVWPREVSPFEVHLVGITNQVSSVMNEAEDVYEKLTKAGIEVLWDDREDVSVGEKFADADLIGIPVRIVVSPKAGEGMVEVKKRNSEEVSVISIEEFLKSF